MEITTNNNIAETKNPNKIFKLIMPPVGTILDNKYEISREIARGGMGIVYEAYHKYTYKRVAIKVIIAGKVDSIRIKRFQKEIEAYSLLSHPNIITIYDAGVYNNYPYIVMEYIEGVNIYTYVKQQEEENELEDSKKKNEKQKERNWKLCAKLIYETALGLEYIHSQKMIHRDIKPSNIIIKSNGSPVIIDLGLVKFNRTQSWNLTKSRELIGTIGYMSIEQAQGNKNQIDARTDVYSLGLVLYELLTGTKAYDADDIMELCYNVIYYYPPLPRKINPQIPEILEKITLHAIEKQKEKRYASAKEFANALKQYLDDSTQKDDSTETEIAQYACYQKRLWFKPTNNKIVSCCIELLLAGIDIINSLIKKEPSVAKGKETSQNKKNNAEDFYQVGLKYYNGEGVQKDLKKAITLFEQSANQGLAIAQNTLGFMYYKGYCVEQDFEKAVYWWEKSSDLSMDLHLDLLYDKGEIAKAQYQLGLKYYTGEDVNKDLKKAIKLFEKSANQNCAKAQYKLGAMYATGVGVKKDLKKALKLLEQSANQGLTIAQENVGFMHYYGYGINQDFEKAVYWWTKSPTQGLATAQDKLDYIYKKSDIVGTQYRLGLKYYTGYNGYGVNQDFEKAFKLFEKSASQGIIRAQFNLGFMYYEGKGSKQDFSKATYWLKKAQESNDKLISIKATKILENIKNNSIQ